MKKIHPTRIQRRKFRVSKNIFGTSKKPRLSVYRSSKHIYAQAIDDEKRLTIISFSSKNLMQSKDVKSKKREIAYEVGKKLGELLGEKQITTVIFDRGRFSYLGRVKKLAEGLREAKIIM